MKARYAIKRNNLATLVILLAIVAGIAAEFLALLSSRANSTYAITALYDVMIMTEVAVAVLIIIYALSFFARGNIAMIVFDVLRLAAVALLCVCLFIVLDERATLMGYVWFSDLESGNANSVNALNYGVASAACYAFTIIVLAVSGAVEFINAKKLKRTREEIIADIEVLIGGIAEKINFYTAVPENMTKTVKFNLELSDDSTMMSNPTVMLFPSSENPSLTLIITLKDGSQHTLNQNLNTPLSANTRLTLNIVLGEIHSGGDAGNFTIEDWNETTETIEFPIID